MSNIFLIIMMSSCIKHNWCTYFVTLFLLLTLLQMYLSSPCFAYLHPAPGLLPSGHHHTVVCVYVFCMYLLWLIPSPSFIQSPHPLPLWQLSVCSMHPCLCFYVVHQFILFMSSTLKWNHMVFSFTNWLILLSIILSRSIQTFANGKISNFMAMQYFTV